MGDLNAHVKASDQDYITFDMNDVLDDFLPTNYIVHKKRNTEIYQNTNEYGRQILDICNDAQLRILNGRTIGDSKGKITLYSYNGTAITDYCICSANVLPNIVSLTVDELNPVLSDHCPISVRLQYYNDLDPSSGLHKPKRKPIIWNKNKEILLKANMQTDFFVDSCREVLEPGNLKEKARSENVNLVINKCSDILYNAALNVSYKEVGPEKKRIETFVRKRNLGLTKSLSRTLQENPWDKHLRIKVYKLKKDFNKLTRKTHRLYRNILINKI